MGRVPDTSPPPPPVTPLGGGSRGATTSLPSRFPFPAGDASVSRKRGWGGSLSLTLGRPRCSLSPPPSSIPSPSRPWLAVGGVWGSAPSRLPSLGRNGGSELSSASFPGMLLLQQQQQQPPCQACSSLRLLSGPFPVPAFAWGGSSCPHCLLRLQPAT